MSHRGFIGSTADKTGAAGAQTPAYSRIRIAD